ncbi:hypothetical protein M569_06541, partial [Genlisea aurea]
MRCRAWLIDSRGLAKKVKDAGLPQAYQIKDCGANRRCPNCHYLIDNSDVSDDWPGLPAGVKFDPSDVELLDHLAAKHGGSEDLDPHVFIDEFIPTIDGDEGICYTHPEKLPGAKKDGSSIHFFHKISNAYGSGPRKRRRINGQESVVVRWHKTGRTKPIADSNGNLRGFKKIMVLYSSSKGGGGRSKPDRCNWVMHQYHIGKSEDESTGEYVPSTPPDCCFHSGDGVCFCCEMLGTHTEEGLHQRVGIGNAAASCGIGDLDDLELDSQPDFHLNKISDIHLYHVLQDLQFDWLDR